MTTADRPLVERLRAGENFYAESSLWYDRKLAEAVDEAADEIERLQAAVAEAYERCAGICRARLIADPCKGEEEAANLAVEGCVEAIRAAAPFPKE